MNEFISLLNFNQTLYFKNFELVSRKKGYKKKYRFSNFSAHILLTITYNNNKLIFSSIK